MNLRLFLQRDEGEKWEGDCNIYSEKHFLEPKPDQRHEEDISNTGPIQKDPESH